MSTYELLDKAGRNKTIQEFPSPYSYTIIMYKLNGCMQAYMARYSRYISVSYIVPLFDFSIKYSSIIEL